MLAESDTGNGDDYQASRLDHAADFLCRDPRGRIVLKGFRADNAVKASIMEGYFLPVCDTIHAHTINLVNADVVRRPTMGCAIDVPRSDFQNLGIR